MIEFLRDPAWGFVACLLALTSVIAAFYIFKLQTTKSLSYQVLTETPLLTIGPEISNDIQITYKGVSIQNVFLVVIRVVNDGKLSIQSSDFETPISLQFGENAQILSWEIVQTIPRSLRPSLSLQGLPKQLGIQPMLLNSRDAMEVKLLITHYDNQIELDGRITGVKEIRRIKNENGGVESKSIVSFFLQTVVAIGLLPLLSYASFWIAEKAYPFGIIAVLGILAFVSFLLWLNHKLDVLKA